MKASKLAVAFSLMSCFAMAQAPAPEPATPATPAPAAAAKPEETAPPSTPPKRKTLKFTPPKDAAEGKRLDGDGGSREEKKFKLPDWLCTLTPQTGIGLTTMPQPSLFTYQSEKANMVFLVKITEPGKPQELFTYAANTSASGIHRVDLSQFDVTLKSGVDYEWSVTLRPDQKNKSSDLVAKGRIRRIEPDAALAEKIKSSNPTDLPAVYAEAGIWYDALATLSDQIAANPKDKDLVTMRTNLLDQVDLKKVAADRGSR